MATSKILTNPDREAMEKQLHNMLQKLLDFQVVKDTRWLVDYFDIMIEIREQQKGGAE